MHIFTVGAPPEFTKKLSPLSVIEGQPCQFEVSVAGSPDPDIAWFKDGEQITDTSVYKFMAGNGMLALVIEEVTMDNTGMFSVKITNKFGSSEISANLTVEKGENSLYTYKFLRVVKINV